MPPGRAAAPPIEEPLPPVPGVPADKSANSDLSGVLTLTRFPAWPGPNQADRRQVKQTTAGAVAVSLEGAVFVCRTGCALANRSDPLRDEEDLGRGRPFLPMGGAQAPTGL